MLLSVDANDLAFSSNVILNALKFFGTLFYTIRFFLVFFFFKLSKNTILLRLELNL